MKRLGWLGVLWPLLAVPFLHDPTPVRDSGTIVRESSTDTTYGDGRYVALVPGVTDTLTHGTDTVFRFVPDPDSVGLGKAYRAVRKPGGDSFLVISYDTLVAAALDSSVVDSIWSAWSLGTPLAYAVDVPDNPTQTDTGGASNSTAPVFVDNFQQYTSSTDFLASYGDANWLTLWDPEDSTRYQIDTTFSLGQWTQSLKLTIPGAPDSASACSDYSVGLVASASSVSTCNGEAWIEFWVAWEPTFTTISDYGCPPSPDHKMFRIATTVGGVFWGTTTGNSGSEWFYHSAPGHSDGDQLDTYYQGLEEDTLTGPPISSPTYLWTGDWQRFRWHVKMSTDSTTKDGTSQLYWNDQKTCWTSAVGADGARCPDSINTYMANKENASLSEWRAFMNTNRRTSYDQHFWLQSAKLWCSDPGWGF